MSTNGQVQISVPYLFPNSQSLFHLRKLKNFILYSGELYIPAVHEVCFSYSKWK